MKVCWFSAGVSSFAACYLAKDVDAIIFIDIDDQHEDSRRFVEDCEKALGKKIITLKSNYGSVENVCRASAYVNGPAGARCTLILKKRVRKEWEADNPGRHTYVWGFDRDERKRADRLMESMPEFDHEFPLIDNDLSKDDAHGLCRRLGVKRPAMYEMGYNNNNCVGCVKGGEGLLEQNPSGLPGSICRESKDGTRYKSVVHQRNVSGRTAATSWPYE